MSFLKKLKKALKPKNAISTMLDPAGGTIRALTGKDPSLKTLVDPGGFFIKDKPKGAAPAADGSGGLTNPYANQTNPFAGIFSQIPPSFFQNPFAQAAVAQALNVDPTTGQPMTAGQAGTKQQTMIAPPPGKGYPTFSGPSMSSGIGSNPFAGLLGNAVGDANQALTGPPPSQETLMGRVGGFGNGGGKMGLAMNTGLVPGSKFRGRMMIK